MNAFIHCFMKIFFKNWKDRELSLAVADTSTLYLVRWVSEEYTSEEKITSLQIFIMYAIPPHGTRNIARYTIPLALGKKTEASQRNIE